MSELWQFMVIGLASGGVYALVALGVVGVYRRSGILNFAQGAIGMFAGYIFWDLYDAGNGSLPAVPAAVIAIAVGAALGLLFYGIVVRFLRNSSDMGKVVATLGLLLLLESLAEERWGTETHLLKPLFGSGRITIFGALMTYDTLAILIITVVLAAGLSYMFQRTRLGMNATALRENPVAAGAVGISPHPTGFLTWGVGGIIAAIAGIMLIPVIGLTPSGLTLLVIPAMAAALIARFNVIWATVVTGLGLGVVEAVMQRYNVNGGIIDSVPFGLIIIAVVLGGRALPVRGEVQTIRLPRVGNGRVNVVMAVVAIGVAVAIPLALSSTWATATINSSVLGLMALSVVVVTGYAGQISVASAALAGFASFMAAQLSSKWDVPFILCILIGTAAAVVLGVVIGAPAVRVRGINLAIVTLGLSLAVEDMVLLEPSLTGQTVGLRIHNPSLFGFNLSPASHPARFAVLCVIVMALGSLAVLNVRRGESGRRYVAVRANERGAASVGVSVSGAKLGAFAVSAALAGLAGALATFQFQVADFSSYDVFQSITTLAFTVVGGVGYVAGAIFAAVGSQGGITAYFVSDVFHWATVNTWLPILTGAFVIQIMIQSPDGVVVMMGAQNRWIANKLVQRFRRVAQVTAPAALAPRIKATWQDHTPRVDAGQTVLVARDVKVVYGNVVAVDDVSLELTAGQVLGVIGPNGAGKTSLIDALSGFTGLAGGTIELQGADVVGLRAFKRARAGMARTFQNLELFEDLSVRENILTALDSRSALSYVRDLFHPGQGKLNPAAEAAIAMLDLERDLDTVVGDLPQGQRRMAAIARLVAQDPVAIMLDEPAAGLSGEERRTACALFRALADELGAAVLLVEHNVDVVSTSCDHLIVLDFGRIIASGPTQDVLQQAAVREAYLGRLASHQGSEGAPKEPAAIELL